MSGTDQCVIKLGEKEMEAGEVGEFCEAIVEMKNKDGDFRSKGMRAYIAMGRQIEELLQTGVSEGDVVGAAIANVEGHEESDLREAGALYMQRRKNGTHKGISEEALSGTGNYETAREDQIISEQERNSGNTHYYRKTYDELARENNEEIINFEMRIPKEIFKKDFLTGVKGRTYGADDMVVATVFVNNPDGTPQYVEETDDAGNVTTKRKTGIRVYSYDHHMGGGSDAAKLFEKHVMAGVQVLLVKKAGQKRVDGAQTLMKNIEQAYKAGAEAKGARLVKARMIENEVKQEIEVGDDGQGGLVTSKKGLQITRMGFTMRKKKKVR